MFKSLQVKTTTEQKLFFFPITQKGNLCSSRSQKISLLNTTSVIPVMMMLDYKTQQVSPSAIQPSPSSGNKNKMPLYIRQWTGRAGEQAVKSLSQADDALQL